MSARRDTVPDLEVRRDPRHAVIAAALRYSAPPHIVVRVWGRYVDNTAAGAVANAWAGTPEDVADTLVRALQAAENPPKGTPP